MAHIKRMTPYTRHLAIISLFCSVIPLLFVNQDNVCFLRGEHVFYLKEITSSGNDDVVFKLLAIATWLYIPVLIIVKYKPIFVLAWLSYMIVPFVLFLWIESTSAYQMIVQSIDDCGNEYLLSWLVLWLLSGIWVGVFVWGDD